jgi:hypothetical protein
MKLKKVLVCAAAVLSVWSMSLGTAIAQPAETDPQPETVVYDNIPDESYPTPPRGDVQARDASGCTLSPGGFAQMNCIEVKGEGTYVNYIRARMEIGANDILPVNNICERAYEFQYYRQGWSSPITRVFNQPGCDLAGPGITFSFTHQVNLNLKDYSTACTRTKSDLTFDEWSPYACVYIIA